VCDVYTNEFFVANLEINFYDCDGGKFGAGSSGEWVAPHEFPHMGNLGWTSGNAIKWLCGTFLISFYYTLTAAHCSQSEGIKPDVIRLGEHDLKKDDDAIDFKIEQFIKHPQYRAKFKYHDIALVRFKNHL